MLFKELPEINDPISESISPERDWTLKHIVIFNLLLTLSFGAVHR
ncbi:hypothetical protein [Anabaena sp. CCY 9614]